MAIAFVHWRVGSNNSDVLFNFSSDKAAFNILKLLRLDEKTFALLLMNIAKV